MSITYAPGYLLGHPPARPPHRRRLRAVQGAASLVTYSLPDEVIATPRVRR